jgi:hypothetical protein
MNTVLVFVLALLLRIVIPVALTALVIFLLHRLDERWQKEALAVPVNTPRQPCWEINGCSEEKRKHCLASTKPDAPCWQVFRLKNGQLREECLGCKVFRLAPIPARPKLLIF